MTYALSLVAAVAAAVFFVVYLRVRERSILRAITTFLGFVACACVAIGGFVGAALAAGPGGGATTVDLSAAYQELVTIAVSLLGVLVSAAITLLLRWLKRHLDIGDEERLRQAFDAAASRGIAYAADVLRSRGQDLTRVDVRHELLALAAQYVADTVPGTLARFRIDGPGLSARLRARLPGELGTLPTPAAPPVQAPTIPDRLG